MIVDPKQVQRIPTQNQRVQGKDGPIVCRVNLNFDPTAGAAHFDLDLQNPQGAGLIDFVQTIFIDNSKGGDTVSVTFKASGQVIVAKAFSQGWYNVICTNPIQVGFDSNGGALCTIFMTNAAVPGHTWLTA